VALVTQAEFGVLLGLLGATCALAAGLAWRMEDSRRDVALMLGTGCVLGVASALLHVF